MSPGCSGKLVPSSTLYQHLTCRKLFSSPTYQQKANTLWPSFANQEISSLLVEPSSWDHEPSSPLLSTNIGTNVDVLGTHWWLFPAPCHEEMTLNSIIANQVVELQRNMDEAKTPIALQNKVLSWVFGGRANVVDATDYTSMGPCPATCPCKFVYKIKHILELWWCNDWICATIMTRVELWKKKLNCHIKSFHFSDPVSMAWLDIGGFEVLLTFFHLCLFVCMFMNLVQILPKQYCVLDFLSIEMQWFKQFYNLHNNTSWVLQQVNKTTFFFTTIITTSSC